MPAVLRHTFVPALAIALGLGACAGDDSPIEPSAPPPTAAAPIIAEANFIHDTWSARPDLPAPRHGLAAASVGGRIYAIGGLDQNYAPLSSVLAYDPASGNQGSWVTRAPLPAKRARPNGAAVIDGKIYVPGGTNGNGLATRTLYVYDPGANAWTSRAQMPVASAGGGSVAIGGRLYVIAPSSSLSSSALYRYDPATDSWTKRAAPGRSLGGAVLGVINGKLYAAGGTLAGDPSYELLVYDPSSNSWSLKASMPNRRLDATGRAVGGKLYVAGGTTTGAAITDRTDVYDPSTNQWSSRADMPTYTSRAAAASVKGLIYVLGGRNGSSELRSNALYIP